MRTQTVVTRLLRGCETSPRRGRGIRGCPRVVQIVDTRDRARATIDQRTVAKGDACECDRRSCRTHPNEWARRANCGCAPTHEAQQHALGARRQRQRERVVRTGAVAVDHEVDLIGGRRRRRRVGDALPSRSVRLGQRGFASQRQQVDPELPCARSSDHVTPTFVPDRTEKYAPTAWFGATAPLSISAGAGAATFTVVPKSCTSYCTPPDGDEILTRTTRSFVSAQSWTVALVQRPTGTGSSVVHCTAGAPPTVEVATFDNDVPACCNDSISESGSNPARVASADPSPTSWYLLHGRCDASRKKQRERRIRASTDRPAHEQRADRASADRRRCWGRSQGAW